MIVRIFLLYLSFAACSLYSLEISEGKRKALYNSIEPKSVSQHLAFYRLFPQSTEGEKALSKAWALLSHKEIKGAPLPDNLPLIEDLIDIVNRPPETEAISVSEEEYLLILTLASSLKNRELKGFYCTTEEEVLALPTEEIDLARALLLSQKGCGMPLIHSYEAVFDLMALQVLARLPENPKPQQIIDGLNRFIFHEKRFRFPPHSCHTENIDLYTFLPSVVDSRRGVCLGVSILYICLAQRMGIPLEIITPPGHIFVRYEQNDCVINIETTARGVNMPDETYLSIETKALERRAVKEVVGMSHMNHAALFWRNGEYEKAIDCYLAAQKYMPDDILLKEFLGYNYLFASEIDKGKALLEEIQDAIKPCAIKNSGIAKEFLAGKVDPEGILAIYESVDENRSSILEKKAKIESTLKRCPEFSYGWFHLAICWLQLHRYKEGLEALSQCHALNPYEPTCEYYLSALYLERLDLPKAWAHYKMANSLVEEKGHHPMALRELKAQLLTTLVGDDYGR